MPVLHPRGTSPAALYTSAGDATTGNVRGGEGRRTPKSHASTPTTTQAPSRTTAIDTRAGRHGSGARAYELKFFARPWWCSALPAEKHSSRRLIIVSPAENAEGPGEQRNTREHSETDEDNAAPSGAVEANQLDWVGMRHSSKCRQASIHGSPTAKTLQFREFPFHRFGSEVSRRHARAN